MERAGGCDAGARARREYLKGGRWESDEEGREDEVEGSAERAEGNRVAVKQRRTLLRKAKRR